MNDPRHSFTQTIIEAASAPAVKASTTASSIVIGVDWLTSGPGLIAALGLAFTAGTFAVNLWSTWRRERRAEQERRELAAIHAAKLSRLLAGLPTPPGVESNRMDLTP